MGKIGTANLSSSKLTENNKDIVQILVVFGGCICSYMMGTMFSWPSPAIPTLLTPEYGITMEEASYLTVIDAVAMIVGSPLFAKLADKIGRKRTMFFVPVLFTICFLITALTKNIYILYVSRVFAGLAYACSFSCVPTYIGEVTTPKVRSRYGHAVMTMVFTGQLVTNTIGFYCNIPTMAYVFLTFPVLSFVTLYFMPESPYYYIMKDNLEKARRSLEILRRTTSVDDELNSLAAAVQRQQAEPGQFKDLFVIRSNRRALIICNLTRAIQQFSGMTAVVVYCQYIFNEAGIPISTGHAAMIFSAILTVSNIFSNIVCDKVGKRLAMVYSCIGVCLTLLCKTIFYFLQQYTLVDVKPASWFPVVAIAIYVIFFCIGQSNVPVLLVGELFSSNMKPYGVMFMNVSFAVCVGGTNKLFLYLLATFGLCIPFFMFTVCAFVSIFLSYYFIPETKGKTLEEIQMMLKGVKSDSQ